MTGRHGTLGRRRALHRSLRAGALSIAALGLALEISGRVPLGLGAACALAATIGFGALPEARSGAGATTGPAARPRRAHPVRRGDRDAAQTDELDS